MSAAVAAPQAGESFLQRLAGHTEIPMAVAAIGIVVMLVVPLPTAVLDLLLVFNLALSLSVLLSTTYLKDPLEFSVFPSLLLFCALFRLALSLSLMRSILSNTDGGALVASFGHLALGGNYVIGFVLFLTLVIVQFIVVTGGTSRIAEVVARFTLDAMPGKQMAIDADLNAGIITDDEARTRRLKVGQESDFYGAMDGASKFVKGDGIAALLVTFICLLGGIIIGLLQQGMDIMGALQTYALLTVGQGLVIQIPGLLMSTASGLIVTRAAAEQDLSHDLLKQVTSRPEALAASGFGCVLLSMVPGLPKLPLLLLGGMLLLAGRRLADVAAAREDAAAAEAALEAEPDEAPPDDMRRHLGVDALELEVGYGLVPLALKSDGGQLLERITGLRKQVAQELGLIVPPIRVHDNMAVDPNSYNLKLRGESIAVGEVIPRCWLAINGGGVAQPLDAEHTEDPTFGLPATWVMPDQRLEAERRGYHVIDAASVCITHLGEAIRQHAAHLLTRQELTELLEVVHEKHAAVVDDLIPEPVSKAALQTVLQNLLEERVSIRDMVTILEGLGEAAQRTSNTDELTEHVRQRLARAILAPYSQLGHIPALQLEPELEKRLIDSIGETSYGAQLQLAPRLLQGFINALSDRLEQAALDGQQPVLVCSRRLRLPLRRLMRKILNRLVVIAYDEVAETTARVETVSTVSVEAS